MRLVKRFTSGGTTAAAAAADGAPAGREWAVIIASQMDLDPGGRPT
jgi:hypothetical protein